MTREPGDYFGMFRRMKIMVDGMEVGGLRPGESLEVDVPPGGHLVQARMDWCSSPAIAVEVGPNEEARVYVEYPFGRGVKHLLYKPGEAICIREV